MDTHQMFTVL